MSVNNLTVLEMRTEIQNRAEQAAFKSGKKYTAGIRAMAEAVGVDYITMKAFALGETKKPSERTLDRVRAFLRDNESKTPVVEEPRTANLTALSNDDIAILLDLLTTTSMDIRDDYQRFEVQTGDYAVSNPTFRALYGQEGRLNKLRKKLESLASCKFDFDVELQSVVPIESD